ncbi:MAG: DNA topoisomerase, partial [Ornithinimicrobium sp.]
TSTLQQEASRKLRLNSQSAMRTAQRLYENGYITYMRTDSTTLSSSAISAARSQARDLYGAEYVPEAVRAYGKKSKNAQEAHEAIRPAGDSFRTPAQVAGELRGQEYALYELIWKRTVASQMADARGSTASVKLGATLPSGTGADGSRVSDAEFSASGTVITFRGFLAAYEEGRDEDRHGRNEAESERRLPKLSEGVDLDTLRAEAQGHQTNPPARYTEATLVKALEEKGIGRPSTYAATVGTIQDRGYVRTRGSALIPTWLAFAVTRLLELHFSRLVDYDFTASMEEDLDAIARGDEQRVDWLQRFYFGDEAKHREGLRALVEDLGDIDARGVSTIEIGEGIVVRVGRYGPYVEDTHNEGEPKRASITDDIAPDEMTAEKGRELLETAADDGRVLGQDPATGRDIVAKAGRYGPYVTEVIPDPDDDATGAATTGGDGGSGPKKPTKKAAKAKPRTGSLFKDMDLSTIELDTALKLLSLPRVVGSDPESGEEITAQNGRYGPYLKRGTDSRSLATEDQIFGITLEEALAIYAQPKQRGRAAAPPLKELGNDPVSEKPVVVKDGRFGAYVTDGETNATLRKDDDPETITAERGFELLADKRAKGPTTRKRAAKKTTKKAATKKRAPAKKAAPKK